MDCWARPHLLKESVADLICKVLPLHRGGLLVLCTHMCH